MPRAAIDTSVLYAAGYRRDERHETGLEILRAIDAGALPDVVVLDLVLAETLNGLSVNAGHDAAVDFLERLETNDRFHVERLTSDGLATAKSVFRRRRALSFADACLVALVAEADLEYLYAFDDDFDRVDDVSRLDASVDPYAPD